VDERRWQAAQRWEMALWLASAASQTTDRNAHHSREFGGYAALPRALGDVVEVGCGPYTQLQSMMPADATAASITLVDPLVEAYASRVKGCTYRHGRLLGRRATRDATRGSAPRCDATRPRPARPAARSPRRSVTLLARAAEELGLVGVADTLVLVGVLQSVRDVLQTLQAAANALRPGGLLIFADRVFDGRWEELTRAEAHGRPLEPFWDVGHPCSVKQVVVDHFLSGFNVLHSRRFSKPARHKGRAADEQLYFIGRKRGTA
jgi:SAM-dependent methyltransferase